MRIAIHADPAAHEIPGGVGVYVRRLVDELLASPGDHSFPLIISRTAEPPPAWSTEELIRPVLPVGQLYAAWNFTGRPRLRGNFDMVHATALAIPPADGKLVATVHDLTVVTMPQAVPAAWRRIYRKGLELAVERAAVLCAVSEATKKELANLHAVETDRIQVTPEAPNVTPESRRNDAVFERLGLREPYILTVGTVEPRKNQMRLVKAFTSVARDLKDWSLVIAGVAAWGQEQVAAAVETSRLGHRIYLTGKVTTSEVASLYAKASVFALVSLYEGFGIPLVEALSFGIPSLASTTPALTELAGTAALTKDPSDTDGIAEGLVVLATDEALRQRLAKEGAERAAQFSWKLTAARTLEAYAKAAEA